MIRVLVTWEREDEIDRALEVKKVIDDVLHKTGLHSGISTTNDPMRTFGIQIRKLTQIPLSSEKLGKRNGR